MTKLFNSTRSIWESLVLGLLFGALTTPTPAVGLTCAEGVSRRYVLDASPDNGLAIPHTIGAVQVECRIRFYRRGDRDELFLSLYICDDNDVDTGGQ